MIWLDLFHLHHDFNGAAFMLRAWPEQKPPLEQSNLVIEIFRVIKAELMDLIAQKRK
jgi:hypothetical protein